MSGIINTKIILLIVIFIFPGYNIVSSQSRQMKTCSDPELQINYSDMDSWYYWNLKESFLIGGDTKRLYQIGKADDPGGSRELLEKDPSSMWKTTNLYARIGVDIAAPCVFPEKREGGYCCRMESKIVKVDVVGIKIKVLVSGTLFLGDIDEPVKSIKDPIRKLNHGILFNGKPKAIAFSYKYRSGRNRTKTYYSTTPVTGPDKGEFCMILQKRWEDEKGNVYAIRIGGTRNFFNDTGNKWVNDTSIAIRYGNITKESFYDPKVMGLIPGISELYVKNSKNKMVPLTEKGWDLNNDSPTHLVLYFTSSYEGINFTGSPDSAFWIDNVRFIY
jgi:hypothetical protein